MAETFSGDAIELIKRWEGLGLSAYPDPGTGSDPWTLGYGHTQGVEPGDTCTAEQAELWLIDDMEWASDAVRDSVAVELPQQVHDALTSFVFNVGAGAFRDSTLLRRLNAGEPIRTVLPQELPRWNRGGGEVISGLVRRRDAEVDLAMSAPIDLDPVAADRSISLVNAALYFKGLPHQVESMEYLEDLLTLEELDEFARIYRHGSQSSNRVLNVRHMIQMDNGDEGYRQCFTTSCAMLLEYLRPGTLSGPNGDLEYLETVERYGDTTDSAAQVKALNSYGLDVEFVTDASWQTLEDQVARGFPTPVGWLHNGCLINSGPSGNGHWSVVIGMQNEGSVAVHNDPFGRASLRSGGYDDHWITAGQAVNYCRNDWGPRWEVEGPGTGWAILAR